VVREGREPDTLTSPLQTNSTHVFLDGWFRFDATVPMNIDFVTVFYEQYLMNSV
jgi:hypothetical protein